MFTGIIEEVGSIALRRKAADGATLQVSCRAILSDVKIGDSIAINGVCQTVTAFVPAARGKDGHIAFYASTETLRLTTLGKMPVGASVNLERALLPTTRMGGHFVQGHVDGVGNVKAISRLRHEVRIVVEHPEDLSRYIAAKGSIAVDGVSLTVVSLPAPACFELLLIPQTIQATTLAHARAAMSVNIEVDILAKYVVGEAPLTS